MTARASSCAAWASRIRAARPPCATSISTIAAGEFAVFLGPSGSGKSTLLRTINRLIEPTTGTVLIDGVDARTLDPVTLRRGIGYVIQAVGLFPHLTIADNVGVVPELLGWERARIARRVDELLDAGAARPGDLSRPLSARSSRAANSSASASRARWRREPRVLLMDEPFGAVDAIVRASLQDEIRRIHRDLGTTIVFVTHDVDEALRLADRIVVDRRRRHRASRYAGRAWSRRRPTASCARWSASTPKAAASPIARPLLERDAPMTYILRHPDIVAARFGEHCC